MAAGDLGVGKRLAAAQGAWICFADEAGQTLQPPKARTWARRGCTPMVRTSTRGAGRISLAGLLCLRPGHRGRLIYRTLTHRRRRGEQRAFTPADYTRLLDGAHQQLGAPIVLVWDNLNVHRSAAMRQRIAARDWLTVVHLPAYAPELNPVEGVWSHMKRAMANFAVTGVEHLLAVAKNRLKRIQYRPELLAGFLAQTGLSLDPTP